MGKLDKNRFSSLSIERETPIDLFNLLDKEFHFTLDPCATPKNTKCIKFYTKEQNGLIQDWSKEVVFCNPPYGKGMTDWIKKSITESSLGATIVVLIPARTNTNWWNNLCMKADEIRFITGRPKFENMKHGLPFPLVLLIFRPNSRHPPVLSTFNLRGVKS